MSSVLVINSGSSSLKFAVVDPAEPAPLVEGLVEQIGEPLGRIKAKGPALGGQTLQSSAEVADHSVAFAMVQRILADADVLSGLTAVGHRVVHGGDRFSDPAVVTDDVVAAIEDVVPLAPLHNPAHLLGIRGALAAYPGLPQVAVFDTAFHATMPDSSYTYALDAQVARAHGLRRYGFHGTSHKYVSAAAAAALGRPVAEFNAITLHLGNGASACAVRNGRSIDTSMGVGPLEGLVMGTRSGDIDPTVVFTLLKAGMSATEVDALLNRGSGLKGLCGDNDWRTVGSRAEAGDPDADLARRVYVHRIRKYIGAYFALLGRVDALVFTAGVGENDPWVRAQACAGLAGLGIAVDPVRNAGVRGPEKVVQISAAGAPVAVLVVPTDEEREIARQTLWALRPAA